MKLPSLSFLLQAFIQVCRRFPATMLCAFTAVGAVITMIELRRHDPDELVKLWLMAQLGLALCTGLAVLAESRGWDRLRRLGAQALGLALLVLYYFLFDLDAPALDNVVLPRYLGLLAAAHLLVAVAPYLNALRIADFWEYNKRLFANFIVGAVYTLILYAGLALALLAVDQLFNLNLEGDIYAHLFAVLAGIFQTTFFLYHLPERFEFSAEEKAYNVVFKNLCQYILIPIVGLYFLILYAYSLKILITWNLPHGWVASLVLGFSVAGIFTYLLNYLLPEFSDNVLVQAYRKYFWWVLLPMVGLLFVAIGRRISDYGITEPRYYVAHAGVWLLAMCLYFLRSKTDNIKFIPISLALFILVAVLGPMSAFQVAERNQTSILKNLLEQNGRFAGDKLQSKGPAFVPTDADRAYSCLHFLARRNALSRLENWLPVPLDSIAPPASKHNAYERAQALAVWLNAVPADQANALKKFISVYQEDHRPFSGDIAGFRSFYQIDWYGEAPKKDQTDARVQVSADRTALLLFAPNITAPQDSFSLQPLLRDWAQKAGIDESYALTVNQNRFDLQGTKNRARLFLQRAQFETTGDTLRLENLNGVLFVK